MKESRHFLHVIQSYICINIKTCLHVQCNTKNKGGGRINKLKTVRAFFQCFDLLFLLKHLWTILNIYKSINNYITNSHIPYSPSPQINKPWPILLLLPLHLTLLWYYFEVNHMLSKFWSKLFSRFLRESFEGKFFISKYFRMFSPKEFFLVWTLLILSLWYSLTHCSVLCISCTLVTGCKDLISFEKTSSM